MGFWEEALGGDGTEHSRGAGIRTHACQLPCLVAPPLLAQVQNRPLAVRSLIPSLPCVLALLECVCVLSERSYRGHHVRRRAPGGVFTAWT